MQHWMAFLRWQFQGCSRSLSFWGFISVLAGIAVSLASPLSNTLAEIIVGMGIVLIFVDAVRAWFGLSYSMYQRERQEIQRRLSEDK